MQKPAGDHITSSKVCLANHDLPADMPAALNAEYRELPGHRLFPNLVFTHPDGSHYSQPTIWKELQEILQKAGPAHYRVHDLRHTFAVNSLRAGDDPKTLQYNMRHYSAAFTLDQYCHVTDTIRHESAERMQAFIESLG